MGEEELQNLLNEVYTLCWVSKTDVEEEKKDLLSQYMTINALLYATFKDNRNLVKALSYFSSLMQDFFEETEFESQIYEAMINYFEQFDALRDAANENILTEFMSILEDIDNKVDFRFLETVKITEHYMDIIESGILTDKNYYHRGLSNKTNKNEKEVILGKIPEVKDYV